MRNALDQRGASNIAVRVGSALADASSKSAASPKTRPPRRTLRSATLSPGHFGPGNLASYALSILSLFLLGAPASADPVPLPGTQHLPPGGDLDSQMLDGIDRFLDHQTQATLKHRASYWKRDTTSIPAYIQSIAPNRANLSVMLGVVDPRVPFRRRS